MPQRKTPDVVNSIFKASSDPQVQTSMVFGSGLESGWNDTAQNPSSATGPYQILLTAHPGVTTPQAENPDFSTKYMLGSYQAAIKQVSPNIWAADPELAAEQAVIIAEQPGGPFPNTAVGPYGGEGVDVVNQRWTQTNQRMSGQVIDTSNLSSSTSSIPSANAASEASDFGRMGLALATGNSTAFFNALKDSLWNTEVLKIALVIFGAIMFLIGTRKLGVHPVRAAEKVAGTATTAVGAVTGQPEVMAVGESVKREGAARTIQSQARKGAKARKVQARQAAKAHETQARKAAKAHETQARQAAKTTEPKAPQRVTGFTTIHEQGGMRRGRS